jgi:hypothetical protein
MGEKANYQLSISLNEGITEIVITGEVTKDNIDQLHNEVINLLMKQVPKAVLVDISEVRAHRDEFSSAYFRTRSLPPDVIRLPAAVVDPRSNADYVSFYETTAANVGQLVKWFADIEAARTWLKNELEKSGSSPN